MIDGVVDLCGTKYSLFFSIMGASRWDNEEDVQCSEGGVPVRTLQCEQEFWGLRSCDAICDVEMEHFRNSGSIWYCVLMFLCTGSIW